MAPMAKANNETAINREKPRLWFRARLSPGASPRAGGHNLVFGNVDLRWGMESQQKNPEVCGLGVVWFNVQVPTLKASRVH